MKQGYFLLITLMFSMGLQAQTLKETIRGKFGEYQGTSETRVRGGKTTTVYRDKYGVVTGTSIYRHSGNKGTITYRDKYGQVTGRGQVRGRIPSKSSSYSYWVSSSKSKR